MMKVKSLIVFFLISAGILLAGVSLVRFTVRSSSGNVILNWETSAETNLKHFVVERKSVNGSYMEIGTVNPRTDRSYEFIDQTAFKGAEQVYVYRLRIVDNDGSISYSEERSVAHNVSTVKRTWGSIKAYFR